MTRVPQSPVAWYRHEKRRRAARTERLIAEAKAIYLRSLAEAPPTKRGRPKKLTTTGI